MKLDTHNNLIVQAVASVVRRRKVLLAALVLVGIAMGVRSVWKAERGPLRNAPRYVVTPENLQTTPRPPWVSTDIRAAAVAHASLQGPLSTLEPQQTSRRIAEALRLQPWVKSVSRVELKSPNRVVVDLQWRQPLAVVEARLPAGARLLPIDGEAVRLPEDPGIAEQLRYLPRITGISQAPRAGAAWLDPRVLGSLALIERFGPDWQRLSLLDVTAAHTPEIRGDLRFHRLELLARGGTRIVWGAAPGVAVPDESPFEVKLAQLKRFISASGADLNTDRSPQWIDVRQDLRTKQRLAKKKPPARTAQKPDAEEEKINK